MTFCLKAFRKNQVLSYIFHKDLVLCFILIFSYLSTYLPISLSIFCFLSRVWNPNMTASTHSAAWDKLNLRYWAPAVHVLFDSHSCVRWILISSFCLQKISSERLKTLSKVTQLSRGRGQFWTQVCLQSQNPFHYSPCHSPLGVSFCANVANLIGQLCRWITKYKCAGMMLWIYGWLKILFLLEFIFLSCGISHFFSEETTPTGSAGS